MKYLEHYSQFTNESLWTDFKKFFTGGPDSDQETKVDSTQYLIKDADSLFYTLKSLVAKNSVSVSPSSPLEIQAVQTIVCLVNKLAVSFVNGKMDGITLAEINKFEGRESLPTSTSVSSINTQTISGLMHKIFVF